MSSPRIVEYVLQVSIGGEVADYYDHLAEHHADELTDRSWDEYLRHRLREPIEKGLGVINARSRDIKLTLKS